MCVDMCFDMYLHSPLAAAPAHVAGEHLNPLVGVRSPHLWPCAWNWRWTSADMCLDMSIGMLAQLLHTWTGVWTFAQTDVWTDRAAIDASI